MQVCAQIDIEMQIWTDIGDTWIERYSEVHGRLNVTVLDFMNHICRNIKEMNLLARSHLQCSFHPIVKYNNKISCFDM
jgi:hypothetical protein